MSAPSSRSHSAVLALSRAQHELIEAHTELIEARMLHSPCDSYVTSTGQGCHVAASDVPALSRQGNSPVTSNFHVTALLQSRVSFFTMSAREEIGPNARSDVTSTSQRCHVAVSDVSALSRQGGFAPAAI